MRAASAKLNKAPETSASDFIHGKDYVHDTGEVVNFTEMSWCISPTRGKQLTVYFRDLPRWLKQPAKLVLAHGWLTEGRSKSWLNTRMVSFRRLAGWLEDFEGASLAELIYEHKMILQDRLTDELMRYNDALEAANLELGRLLSFRESRRICRESRLLGPKSIDSLVSTFNYAARLLEEIDGLVVSVRLQNPRIMNYVGAEREVGSADPNKVLAPQQIAELEWALGRDLRRYQKARALIERVLGDLDLNSIEPHRPNPVFDLERYFGLNGFREHTSSEIAALRGLSPSGHTNVPQLIKRFLSKKTGASLADKVMKLRSQFGTLRAQKRFEEVTAAREYILGVLANADLSFREPKAFCLERYFGLHGHRAHSLSAIAKQLGVTTFRPVFYHVREGLFSLIGERNGKRLLAVRERLQYYLTRAIKAQALRLQLGVARRISAVLEIPVKPKIKVQTVEARRIVEIEFRAGKTWGDEGFQE